ncbi:sensor histidine kinase [Candidatus Ferrigenium straubiae]|jgi:signal transduction histidine kinase|uniref:sensor histidine kinase n=1 Tax=Candidatus Ferrigenium straubiae TaxID=2919506 RepID=UPI003F4AB2AE
MYAKSIGQLRQRRQSVASAAEAKGRYTSGRVSCRQQTELQRLSARLLEVQESERRRIATDLHDVLGQSLTVIKLMLDESVMLLAANETKSAAESLQQMRLKVKGAFEELRCVSMNLRPAIIDDLGILATLSWFFREFEMACQGIKVEKSFGIQEGGIPAPLKIIIFRIIQEATNNIVKHANASHIRVSLKRAGATLHLSIDDNGDGFDPLEAGKSRPFGKGLGLLSMKERAELSGGTYVMESRAGQGTRINVSWPLSELEDRHSGQKVTWRNSLRIVANPIVL